MDLAETGSSRFESREDRAGAAAPAGACRSERREGIPGVTELFDPCIERVDPGPRQFARARSIIRCVEIEQFLDFVERETRCLCGSNEPQSPHLIKTVASYLAWRSSRFRQQSAALVIADSLDAHSRSLREPADRVRISRLIPYHGTEAIRLSSAIGQKENPDGKDRKNDRLHLQLHQGRMSLQSLCVQELQLLTQEGPRPKARP